MVLSLFVLFFAKFLCFYDKLFYRLEAELEHFVLVSSSRATSKASMKLFLFDETYTKVASVMHKRWKYHLYFFPSLVFRRFLVQYSFATNPPRLQEDDYTFSFDTCISHPFSNGGYEDRLRLFLY